MTLIEAQRVAKEILEGVEAPERSLEGLLRKAIHLADLVDEREYKLLFEMHLVGHDTKLNPSIVGQTGWPYAEPPVWPIGEEFMKDRSTGDGNCFGHPISELESTSRMYSDLIGPNITKLQGEDITSALVLKSNFDRVLSSIRNRLASFGQEMTRKLRSNTRKGDVLHEGKVFIGHGRSPLWRELKDLLAERLELECDEFNRESAAGVTVAERLEKMLSEATFAFLIMTAEDQQADQSMRARENVVHEVGLFQGKLGFRKAIVLLEEKCSEFSNIHGLGQIRFPSGNIRACFEDVRAVLEREGVI